MIRTASSDEYRQKVKRVYGGPKGAMLAACSMVSLHVPLGERLFKTRKFDLNGLRSILDVGSGAGQIASQATESGVYKLTYSLDSAVLKTDSSCTNGLTVFRPKLRLGRRD